MDWGIPSDFVNPFDPRRYDAEVRDLALAKTRGHMVLAELCATVADHKVPSKLLFRSQGDYALEKLGMTGGFFSHLIAAGRKLRNLPEISKALHAGELNWSQAVELCRVATPETEAAYIGSAKGQTVRWLRRVVRQLQMSAPLSRSPRERVGVSGCTADQPSGWHEDQPNGDEQREAESAIQAPSLTPAPLPKGEGNDALPRREGDEDEVDLSLDPSPDGAVPRPEPRGTLRLEVPPRLVLKWKVFQDFCRKLEGQPLGTGECLFMLAGEAQAIAGLSDQVTEEARYRMPEIRRGREASRPRATASTSMLDGQESTSYLWRFLDWDPASGEWSDRFDPFWALDGIDREDPIALDRRIVALRAWLQQVDRQLAKLLRHAFQIQLHITLCFSSIESYAQERLGISKTRAFELIRTDELLDGCPKLQAAYASGQLSVSQVNALALIATDETAEAWIRYAKAHPVAHLLRVVRYCRVARFSHPELIGGPCYPPSREVELRLRMSGLDRPVDTDPDRPSWVPREQLSETFVLSGPLWVVELLREVMLRLISQWPARLWPYEAFEILLDDFIATHGQLEHKEPAVFARDDYLCQVPCCTRSLVEAHHIRFRSAGGSNQLANLTAICPFHHRRGIHSGRIRLRGSAPLELRWLFRLEPNGKTLAYYRHQRRIWPQA